MWGFQHCEVPMGEEKLQQNQQRNDKFLRFHRRHGVIDHELSGGNTPGRKKARLDRILFMEEWEPKFRNIRQHILHRVTSDHSHIMLQCGSWENTKSYFKF